MTAANKQDSNTTGLRYAEEATIGVLPVSNPAPVWYPLEPNSYADFGGEVATVTRSPINASRQRSKGVVVDVDSAGGFNSDLVPTLQDLLQGFFFADFRRKAETLFPEDFAEVFTTTHADETMTITAHGLNDGDGPFQLTTVTTLPAGWSLATNYWVIWVDVDTLKLATTRALALAGTAVAISDDGTGAHTMTNTTPIIGGASDDYIVNNPAGFLVDHLLFASGFPTVANNGLKVCNGVTAEAISITTDLTAELTSPYGAKLQAVGFESAAGDLDIDSSGTLPVMTSTALDFTTLGLIPGEWIYIGGDVAANYFTTAANNGFARIYSVAANVLTFDKTQFTMVTEANTTKEIRIFFGRMLKNESDTTLITRRTYQLERTLGAPDDASPAQVQSEYIVGSVPNELTFTFDTADKVHMDIGFMSTDHEQRTGVVGVKSGARPAIVSADAFNTSNDFSRLKMSLLDRTTGANPSALFAYLTQFSISINNNISPNKAISVVGAFDMTAGQFTVSGSATAYFANTTAVAAVRSNSDVTIDFALVKDNQGVVVDLPLVTLGDGRLAIEQDSPITLDLSTDAAADAVFDTTLIMCFYDYLPTAAAA